MAPKNEKGKSDGQSKAFTDYPIGGGTSNAQRRAIGSIIDNNEARVLYLRRQMIAWAHHMRQTDKQDRKGTSCARKDLLSHTHLHSHEHIQDAHSELFSRDAPTLVPRAHFNTSAVASHQHICSTCKFQHKCR